MLKSKILFNMSGSIAAYKACDVISQLVKAGHEVQVVCTAATFEFIGRSTLEGLTGRPALHDMYAADRAMDHIQLARWADLALLCPASAHTLAKLAQGLADDLVSALYLAWEKDKPYLIAPAMNSHMYLHPATQANLMTLSGRGARILGTGSGPLACGEIGEGRLLEPHEILSELESLRSPKGDVLITFGGTRETIDGVRFITNMSTGATGAELSDRLSGQGWNVTCLRAEGSTRPQRPHQEATFRDFRSLDSELRRILDQQSFRAVIHMAAVSDFSVDQVIQEGQTQARDGKLSSSTPITLQLKPNFKIVSRLKDYASPQAPAVIAFKLTNTVSLAERHAAAEKLLEDPVDYVIHNDMNDLQSAGSQRPFQIFKSNRPPETIFSVSGLAQWFNSQFQGEKK